MSGNVAFRKKEYWGSRWERNRRNAGQSHKQKQYVVIQKNNSKDFNKWKRHTHPIQKELLLNLYQEKKKSMQEISEIIGCSLHKVMYWMRKYKLRMRTRGEAMYVKNNPDGDPFRFKHPKTAEERILYGLGLGLYWGEGTKASKYEVRLGNTDFRLLKKFILFLEKFFDIKKEDLKFGLQIFSDIDSKEAMDFWVKNLSIKQSQFYKPTITRSGSIGTYRKKSEYGVLTVIYHNKKLRDLLISKLPL